MKLLKLIANLGYGSRREVDELFDQGLVTLQNGTLLNAKSDVDANFVLIDGEPLDPLPGFILMLHKPLGYTCSSKDSGRLIYDLLPPRFRYRKPVLSSVGRLDKETSGLLLMTDDGQMLHKISSPKTGLDKVYVTELASDLRGDESDIFASGTLMLDNEVTPLKPARMITLGQRQAQLTLQEGRYHQVRRMFAAVGNHVETLHRSEIGGLTLGDLAPGEWRILSAQDLALLYGNQTTQ